MTKDEVTAIQARVRVEWAKYQKAAEVAPRRFQHFASEEERAEHARRVKQDQDSGETPF